jgi:hypothetical protein
VSAKVKQRANHAHHEAGHAVASFYLGIKFKYVTIVEDKETFGHVRNSNVRWAPQGLFDDSVKGIDRAERYIISLFAGPLASRKFHPGGRWRVGGAGDFRSINELLFRIAGEDPECQRLYYKLLRRRAELLVEHRWKEIEYFRHLAPLVAAHAVETLAGWPSCRGLGASDYLPPLIQAFRRELSKAGGPTVSP